MLRATITQHNPFTVRRILPVGHDLNYTYPQVEVVADYWIGKTDGGEAYVRTGPDGRQVCAGLSNVGPTLWATPETLLRVIREEHARELRWENEERQAEASWPA